MDRAQHLTMLTRDAGLETIWRNVDYAKHRVIHGIIATREVSSNGRARDPMGCRAKLPVPLFCGHQKGTPIGEIVYVRKHWTACYCRALIAPTIGGDAAWELICRGEIRGFSVGSRPIEASDVDGTRYVSIWRLTEVSITRTPANRSCYFEVFKGEVAA